MPKMTFHESYGTLPASTLRLVRRYNVSPMDFDYMTDILGFGSWEDVNYHIENNSTSGMYRPRYF